MPDRPKLLQLRRRIDAIDIKLLRLLVQRAAIVNQVRPLKDRNGVHIRPGREVTMIKALLRRPRGHLPAALIVKIWREMIANFTLHEQHYDVAVTDASARDSLWDLARDFFGNVVPLHPKRSAMAAITAVVKKQQTLALLPLPRAGEKQPWWPALERQRDLKVYMYVPFAAHDYISTNGRGERRGALAVSRLLPDPTGDDVTLVIINADLRSQQIKIAAKQVGLQCQQLIRHQNLQLLTLVGYHKSDSKKLQRLATKLDLSAADLIVVGGYALPYQG